MDFGNLELPGSTLGVAYGAFMLLFIGLIVVLRYWLRHKSKQRIKDNFSIALNDFSLSARNKYPAVDVFKMSSTFFNIGLVLSITMVFLAFSWTQYDRKVELLDYSVDTEEIIDIETIRTKEKRQPPPPPPPLQVEVVPDEEVIDTIEFVTIDINEDFERPAPVKTKVASTPPPPVRPTIKETLPSFFTIVEQMPEYKGCETVNKKKERKKCADQKMLTFIYKNIKYPAIARENNVQGIVVVRFVVNKDGVLEDFEILRNPGAGLGEEALRVVKMMPSWNPGKQMGRPVNVQFNLPIKFKLDH